MKDLIIIIAFLFVGVCAVGLLLQGQGENTSTINTNEYKKIPTQYKYDSKSPIDVTNTTCKEPTSNYKYNLTKYEEILFLKRCMESACVGARHAKVLTSFRIVMKSKRKDAIEISKNKKIIPEIRSLAKVTAKFGEITERQIDFANKRYYTTNEIATHNEQMIITYREATTALASLKILN